MSSFFNILKESPYDQDNQAPLAVGEDGQDLGSIVPKWVPSHYTVRATTQDGRLILWNTYSGAMSVFQRQQAPNIKRLVRASGITAPAAGLVKYLAERGFLVKEGTNEYRRLQVAFGRQHFREDKLELILLASEDCNFRCQYCYEQFARGTMEPWVREGIKRLIRNRLRGLRRLTVGWFGGEPLYGLKAIEDLAPFFWETVKENDLAFRSHMTTNGYLLTPDIAERLLAWGVTTYQITVDGPCETHDFNRPTRDGKGTYEQIFCNLRSLHERSDDFQVTVRVNFDRRNYPHITQLFEEMERDLECDPRFRLSFHAVGRWGGANDPNLEVCGANEIQEVTDSLQAEARKRGLNIGLGLRDVNRFGSGVCYAARPFNFIIGASGKIMKCTVALDTEDHNVVGHLTEDGEMELNEDNFALWTEPAFESDKKCQKCVVLPLCQGLHCPLVRIDEHRSPCTPIRLSLKKRLVKTEELTAAGAKKVAIRNRSEPCPADSGM